MTRDDIIRMAQEADDFADSYTPQYVTLPNEWSVIRDERFAALVAAAEREACAKVCEDTYTGEEACGDWPTPEMCAAAIRARGQEAPSSAP